MSELDFEYTAEVPLPRGSSLVDEVLYDAKTASALITLSHNDEQTSYRYSNVPLVDVEKFRQVESAGNYFGTFKRKFGPGENLGSAYDLLVDERQEEGKGTPKGLTYASDAKVDGKPVSHLSLVSSAPEKASGNRTRIIFDAPDGEKNHTSNYDSVDDAVAAVAEIASMLDLDLKVKEVTVYFE